MDADQLAQIEATVLGVGGTVYGDDVLALVAEVRRLQDGIQAHRERTTGGDPYWASKALWELVEEDSDD